MCVWVSNKYLPFERLKKNWKLILCLLVSKQNKNHKSILMNDTTVVNWKVVMKWRLSSSKRNFFQFITMEVVNLSQKPHVNSLLEDLPPLSPEVDLIESSSYELDFLKIIDDNRNLYYDEDFIARYILRHKILMESFNNCVIGSKPEINRSFHGFGQAKFAYGCSVLGLSQFTLLLPQLPSKILLNSKVVKMDPKIIISLSYSNSVTHSSSVWTPMGPCRRSMDAINVKSILLYSICMIEGPMNELYWSGHLTHRVVLPQSHGRYLPKTLNFKGLLNCLLLKMKT